MTWAWISLVVSALFGLLVLLALSGSLGRADTPLDIYRGGIRPCPGEWCELSVPS